MRRAARQGDPLALLILAAGCRAKSRRGRGATAIAAMPALLRASAAGLRSVDVIERSQGAGAGRHGIRERIVRRIPVPDAAPASRQAPWSTSRKSVQGRPPPPGHHAVRAESTGSPSASVKAPCMMPGTRWHVSADRRMRLGLHIGASRGIEIGKRR